MEGGIGSPQPEAETLPLDGLRSQLLPIGAPASACPRRHLLTGRPWRLVEASCTLGPALCTSPCSVTSSARPSAGQSSSSAGGIRTHGLELMRLARTAAPLPRKSGRLESNQRSPAPEAGGMALFPTTSLIQTPGGTRTRSLRVESPVSSRNSTTGARSSGGRNRTCASRVTAARLAARPRRNERRRQQDSNLRTAARPSAR